MHWLKHLTFAKLEFTIEATEPLLLPPYKGSTFRGAFGNIFKEVVCIKDDRECGTCILTENCSYHYVFETPNPGKFNWFSSPKLPHPYILEPPLGKRTEFARGERLRLNLILFGKAIDLLPYFIFVFDEIGRRGGIGKYRQDGFGRFLLKGVRDVLANGEMVYDGVTKLITGQHKVRTGTELLQAFQDTRCDQLTLTFLTPTRIKHYGEYLLRKRNGDFPIEVLLENLYRRAYLIIFSHCHDQTAPFKVPNFGNIQIQETELHWQDWERYSNRQQRRHPFGGFIGRLVLEGELAPWLPLLKAGEFLHAGSATSFGLGKYQVKR